MIESSLLWSIADKSAALKPSYLFGTMHVCDDVAYVQVDKAIRVMQKCRSFKTEIDLEDAKQQIQMKDYCFLDGKTIRDYLSEKQYEKSSKIISKSFGVNLDSLQRFLPVLLVSKLTETELGKDNPLPLDSYLWEQAGKYKLNRGGLESTQEQISTLRSLAIEEQVRAFRKLCRNIPKFKQAIAKMATLYSEQNIQELYLRSAKGLGVFRKPLLYMRNEIMAQRIEADLAEPTFYAVGAAHLAGQKGLLNLLKQKGLKLTAFK